MKTLRGAEAFAYLERYPDCEDVGGIDLYYDLCDEDEGKGLDNGCTLQQARKWIASGKCDESAFYVSNVVDYEECKDLLLAIFKERADRGEWLMELWEINESDTYYFNETFVRECAERMAREGILTAVTEGRDTAYGIPLPDLTLMQKVKYLVALAKEGVYINTEKALPVLLSLESDV